MTESNADNSRSIDEVIAEANARMLAADAGVSVLAARAAGCMRSAYLTTTLCAGTPDMEAPPCVPSPGIPPPMLEAFGLDRPHETDERSCLVVEGVPLCIVCALQACGRPTLAVGGVQYVAVAPSVSVRHATLAKAVDEYRRGLAVLAGAGA